MLNQPDSTTTAAAARATVLDAGLAVRTLMARSAQFGTVTHLVDLEARLGAVATWIADFTESGTVEATHSTESLPVDMVVVA